MRSFAKLAEMQQILHHCDMPTNLTVPQVAQLCEVSEGTVRLWIRDEKLPAKKLFGGTWRVALADLEASSGLKFTQDQVEAVKHA